jgi:hypothetical protein
MRMADLLFSILAGGVGLGAGDKEEQRSRGAEQEETQLEDNEEGPFSATKIKSNLGLMLLYRCLTLFSLPLCTVLRPLLSHGDNYCVCLIRPIESASASSSPSHPVR